MKEKEKLFGKAITLSSKTWMSLFRYYTLFKMFCVSYNVKYLETNYLDADRDKPYHFKFAQSNGVLHMSLAAPQQKGWAVHPSQDQMKVSLYYYDSVIFMYIAVTICGGQVSFKTRLNIGVQS